MSFLNSSIATAAVAVAALHAKVEELQARVTLFTAKGYTAEADTLARQNTAQLLTPLANKAATPAEAEAMVGAHLSTELYYAFNTEHGIGKTRNHRIVYDFLCQFNKATAWNANQKEHLTTLTILSLAAQEYFWNEKSTVIDLRNCVKTELRCGLFNQAGHKLNISSLTYLDDTNLNRLITKWVDDSLVGKLTTLMEGFRAKTLGATYTAIFDDLTTKLASAATKKLHLDLPGSTIADFGLAVDNNDDLDLKGVRSVGDGMCGQHSLFIPTDGGMVGIQKGNGRYKMLRAILDNANTPEVRRLYLLASQHMDGLKFEALLEKQITALRLTSVDQADELQAKLDAYREINLKRTEEIECYITASKRTLVTAVTQLPGLITSLKTLSIALNTPAQLVACSTDRTFRNIVDELIRLRGVNAELNRLLSTIDADILRLNTEANTARSAADTKLIQDKAAAQKTFSEVQGDFEKFKVTNAVLLAKALGLINAHGKVSSDLAKLAKVTTTSVSDLQAAIDKVSAAVVEFNKFKEANLQFFKDHEAKEATCKQAAEATTIVAANYAARDAKTVEKYRLIGDTLKGFIGENMLSGASTNAFTIGALSSRYGSFINDFCRGICVLTEDNATLATIRAQWDACDGAKIAMEAQKEQQLTLRRLEIAATLPVVPAELSPETLKQEMLALAQKVDYEGSPTELGSWLPCDALYTQLWAALNNLNVFVFSDGEAQGRSPLDVMLRLKDSPYEQTITAYPTGITGDRLATVILTSSTAKNIFVKKIPGHYDKYINGLVEVAREIRHVNWEALGADRYKLYPVPDPVVVPLLGNKGAPLVLATTAP